jgi:D-alanyl-D-alanine dipeptidase
MFAEVMKNYGFYPLESEWWHFQDNDSRVDYMDYYISDDGKIVKYDE